MPQRGCIGPLPDPKGNPAANPGKPPRLFLSRGRVASVREMGGPSVGWSRSRSLFAPARRAARSERLAGRRHPGILVEDQVDGPERAEISVEPGTWRRLDRPDERSREHNVPRLNALA